MNIEQANEALLQAVIEPRKAGAIQQIEEACRSGADPNGICPETSASSGPVRAGRTLLTHAIAEGASRVVEKLIHCGADANLVDELGWSPWMLSTLAEESKRERIQGLLTHCGARKEGDHLGDLARAIYNGQVDRAATLFKSEADLSILATYRVDLVRHTISQKNTAMLELLLQHGLTPNSDHLYWAIHHRDLAGADVFLRHGVSPEGTADGESLLMLAAGMGDMDLVRRLVEAGADVNRSAWGNLEWTAAFSARRAGNEAIAEWLVSHMDEALLEEIRQRCESRDPKYRALYENATSGEGLRVCS